MVPLTPLVPHDLDAAFDLDLGLRDAPRAAVAPGVIDLTGRLRPAGPRRSSRHTHTRLIAALARIHADADVSPDPERRAARR